MGHSMYGNNYNTAQIDQILMYLHAKSTYTCHEGCLPYQMKGFSNLFTMLNFEMLHKAGSLMQMNITESRKFLAFVKILHALTSLVYPVSCRNVNVTLEICYRIPAKYAFCWKRQKLPHSWSLGNLSAS